MRHVAKVLSAPETPHPPCSSLRVLGSLTAKPRTKKGRITYGLTNYYFLLSAKRLARLFKIVIAVVKKYWA